MTCVFYSKTDVRRKPNRLPQHWDCYNLRQNIPDFNTHLIILYCIVLLLKFKTIIKMTEYVTEE